MPTTASGAVSMPKLADFTRRFWISAVLLAMSRRTSSAPISAKNIHSRPRCCLISFSSSIPASLTFRSAQFASTCHCAGLASDLSRPSPRAPACSRGAGRSFSTQPACRQFCRDVPHELNFRWQGGLRVFRSLNLVKSCRILPWR
jgi:hypothetical protein